MLSNIDRARDALQHIDPGCPRDEWVTAGMAAKAAELSFDQFHGWSKPAHNYRDEADCRSVWQSFNGSGVTPATLFAMALAQGWQDPAKTRHNGHDARKAAAGTGSTRKAEEAPRRGAKRAAGATVSDVWERCVPADAADAYIHRKQGTPDGLRLYPASAPPLTIKGQSVAGYLAVPCWQDEHLNTIQFTPPDGGAKLNLPGAHFGDGFFTVGEITHRVFIVEGLGQAWAAWKVTGKAAVVTFGAGRMATVAAALRAKYPAARLVVVPDRGKESQAAAIAADVAGEWCELPGDKPANYDANDFLLEAGADALADLLENAKAPPKRFKLLSSADILALPPLKWRIKNVLPAEGVAAVFGASASGKSFIGFDMAAAIAGADPFWFSYRVEAAPVVYVILEGEAGFRVRVPAWEAHKHRKLPEHLRMILQPFKLTEPQDVRDLAAVVPAGAVVFIDTLNRAAPTADENSSKDMGEILEAVKQLQALTGGLVVLIHHTGKDATKGPRGHSSLIAALDSAVEVSRDGDRREWSVSKAKDGADGELHPFKLEVKTLGIDEYGDTITSCVVVPDTAAGDIKRVKLPQGGNQRVVLDALRPMFKGGETCKPGAPPLCHCIELEAAIASASGHLTCETSRRATRAREAITGLVSRGVMGCNEGWIWLTA